MNKQFLMHLDVALMLLREVIIEMPEVPDKMVMAVSELQSAAESLNGQQGKPS